MMTNKKQRPQNGPGANSLRGGINLYSSKVIIGRWQDDIGGPIAFKRGFTTSDYDTEAQHQQRGATLKAPTYYGSALPITGDLYKTESPTWETTTRHMSIGNQKVIFPSTILRGTNPWLNSLNHLRLHHSIIG